MQIVRELAGYSFGRSDLVRRAMSKKKADYFKELIVEKGYKFILNEIIPLSEGKSGDRGNCAADIIDALYTQYYPEKVEEFWARYMKPGDPRLLIEYEDNVVIEYTGDKKMIFHFVEEKDNQAYFDVYAIE